MGQWVRTHSDTHTQTFVLECVLSKSLVVKRNENGNEVLEVRHTDFALSPCLRLSVQDLVRSWVTALLNPRAICSAGDGPRHLRRQA